MPDKTKVVFAGGGELIVDAEPSEVMGAFNRQEPWHHLKSADGFDVYLVDSQVAYLEQVPESEPREPLVSMG